MHLRIIKAVRPYLIQNGRPTGVVKKLHETEAGKQLVQAMFAYYASIVPAKIECCGWELDTNINIEDYRWYQADDYLDRLRRAGL